MVVGLLGFAGETYVDVLIALSAIPLLLAGQVWPTPGVLFLAIFLTVPNLALIATAPDRVPFVPLIIVLLVIDIYAVRMAQQRATTGRRDRERYAIENIGRAVARAPTIEELADVIHAQGPYLMGVAGRSRLWVLDQMHYDLRQIATGDQRVIERGRMGQCSPDLLRFSIDAPVACAQAARFKKEVAIADLRTASHELAASRQQAERDGYLSILAVPMLNRRHLVGVLTFEPCARRPYRFTERQHSYLRTIAGLGAVAVDTLASGAG
jgi:hypothetical protein